MAPIADELLNRDGLWDRLQATKTALTQAQKERDNAATTCKEAQTDCRRLREVLTVVNAKNTNDECHPYHAWEPGGDNHLETLSCPVLIPAQWLRDLIGEGGREAQAERDALVERVERVICQLASTAGYHWDVMRKIVPGNDDLRSYRAYQKALSLANLRAAKALRTALLPNERSDGSDGT